MRRRGRWKEGRREERVARRKWKRWEERQRKSEKGQRGRWRRNGDTGCHETSLRFVREQVACRPCRLRLYFIASRVACKFNLVEVTQMQYPHSGGPARAGCLNNAFMYVSADMLFSPSRIPREDTLSIFDAEREGKRERERGWPISRLRSTRLSSA